MWEDVKPVPHPHASLIVRYAQLYASGEIAAGHFICEYNEVGFWSEIFSPSWSATTQYRLVEGPNHPGKRHDAIKAEWEAVKDKGTHELWGRWTNDPVFRQFGAISLCADDYEIRPIAKPKLKLIDKTKLPIGTMTNFGRLMAHAGAANGLDRARFWHFDDCAVSAGFEYVRIAPMTEWLSWQGGECPVPAGCMFEAIQRGTAEPRKRCSYGGTAFSAQLWGNGDIIAYRIVGIADGWTDDPAKAGE